MYIKESSLMCIRGYPRLNCYRKLSLESLKSVPILYLWLVNFFFKVNDGIFVSINLIANLKAHLKCLFFLLSSEEIAANKKDSHSFQLTVQMPYYFLQPISYDKAV